MFNKVLLLKAVKEWQLCCFVFCSRTVRLYCSFVTKELLLNNQKYSFWEEYIVSPPASLSKVYRKPAAWNERCCFLFSVCSGSSGAGEPDSDFPGGRSVRRGEDDGSSRPSVRPPSLYLSIMRTAAVFCSVWVRKKRWWWRCSLRVTVPAPSCEWSLWEISWIQPETFETNTFPLLGWKYSPSQCHSCSAPKDQIAFTFSKQFFFLPEPLSKRDTNSKTPRHA